MPAGAINQQSREWREKKGKVLFWANNLARVFRAKCFEALRLAGLRCDEQLPNEWVVDCTDVGHGEQALVYLGRYLYRGVLTEKDSIADSAGRSASATRTTGAKSGSARCQVPSFSGDC
ncbi:transposase [Synechococcus sp. RedBA-s]|uniref:transposase n=1 Tax=Synechococcus sp. RedBA-s TaxID=2823741 RepID=UPI0037DA6F9D|nr:transposase [Synechococcus sp. RedBA-s]